MWCIYFYFSKKPEAFAMETDKVKSRWLYFVLKMRQKEKLIKDLDLIGYIFEIEKDFVFDWIDVLVQLW